MADSPKTSQRSTLLHFFSPCPRGLEAVLVTELQTFGATEIEASEGGVAFRGDLNVCYRSNLESRVASRVLLRVGQWPYKSEEDVYKSARTLAWRDHFDVAQSIRVNVSAIGSPLNSLDFITLRIKDAICDRFRADTGNRPNVDTAQPDVRVHAFFEASKFTLYLDTSGEPLFKRGWRSHQVEAPLRENLAAGIIMLTGWDRRSPLLDPMCGGGTLLIEAAMLALNIAPGIARRFGFEKLRNFEAEKWDAALSAARAAQLHDGQLPLLGGDLYGEQLKLARANLESAGLAGTVSLKQANVLEMPRPAESGVLIANPPYGVRMGEQDDLARFYPQLGDALKQRFAGWSAWIFTADLRLPNLIGLKPSRRIPLYNGALECRLYGFELVSGAMRRQKAGEAEADPQIASRK